MQIYFPRNFFSRTSLVAGFVFVAAITCRAQEPPQSTEFDALAAKAANIIQKKSKLPFSSSRVLVTDFVETQGPPSELGAELAREFSESLAKHAQGFTLLNRTEYLEKFSADKLSADSYDNPGATKCYENDFGVVTVVTGSLDDLPDKVILRVQAKRVADLKNVFDERISMPLTSDMRTFISMPARGSNDGVQILTNGDVQTPAPKGGTNGYTMPTCVYCPRADYSDAAVKARFSGRVLLTVEVSGDGLPASISLAKGTICGLNQKAIEAVRKWKFNPAIGPDGNPATVTVPIEIQFHLFRR
jgi:TonB family protein